MCASVYIVVLDGIASLHGMKKNYELNGTVMIITLLNCISHLPFLPVVMLVVCVFVKCSKYNFSMCKKTSVQVLKEYRK